MTDEEKSALIAFLESLTDERFMTDPRLADPWTP
jgi:cytochrome c peroxidase